MRKGCHTMKKAKKLLRIAIALLLVFCSFGSVMTAGATNTKKDIKAFKSITIGGRKVRNIEDDAEHEVKTKKPKVKVKVAKGWKLKKIIFNHGEGTKNQKIKNGGTIKLKGVFENYVIVTAKKGKKTAKVEICVYKD